jgi:hypothetical protein
VKAEGMSSHRCCTCPKKVIRLQKYGSACVIHIGDTFHKGVDRQRLIGKEDPRFIDQHSMSRAGTGWRSRDMEPQHIGYRGAVEETCVPEVGAQFQQAMLLMAMHCELCPIGE